MDRPLQELIRERINWGLNTDWHVPEDIYESIEDDLSSVIETLECAWKMNDKDLMKRCLERIENYADKYEW